MELVAVLVRLVHLGSATLAFGILAFACLVGGPALRAAEGAGPAPAGPLPRRWLRSARCSGFAAMGAALLDLGRQTTVVTAQGWGASLTPSILGAVLTQTRYGGIWLIRQALLAGVAVALTWRGSARGGPDRRLQGAALLAGASLAALGAAGHAASAPSWPRLAIAVDATHLLATGAWLGGLLPLVLFLRWAGRSGDRAGLEAAAAATRRFSALGLVAMTILTGTGVFNLWEHVPSVPALLGTPYGHWLSLKLGVCGLLLGVAAGSRWVVKPRLLAVVKTDEAPAARWVVGRLRRQVLMELTLGSAILATVAVLGLTPPAHHVPPSWPLPFRLAWAAMSAGPGRPLRMAAGSGLAVLGLLVVGAAWRVRPRPWAWLLGLGVVTVAVGGILALPVVAVPAHPTTYLRPSTPYTAAAIVRGEALYQAHCGACHEEARAETSPLDSGHPPRPRLEIAPLGTGRTVGDLFWVVTHGVPGSPMLAFGDLLAVGDRWAILHYLIARTAADRARTLGPDLGPRSPPIAAPDFDYATLGGESGTLREHREHHSVLLVLFSVPQSLDRLVLLSRVAATLREAGLEILAVPLHPDPALDRQPALRALTLPIVVDGAAEVAATYRLFEGPRLPSTRGLAPPPLAHMELLVDPQGDLRARWIPDHESEGWANPARLQAEVLRVAEETHETLASSTHAH